MNQLNFLPLFLTRLFCKRGKWNWQF